MLNISGEKTYTIGPVEVRYGHLYGQSSQQATLEKFEHDFASNEKKKGAFWIMTLCGLIFISVLIILITIVLKKRKNFVSSNSLENLDEYMKELNAVRVFKVNGDSKEYQKRLVSLYKSVLDSKKMPDTSLDKLLEEISFAGKVLNISETMNIEKKIEHLIGKENDDF